MVSMMELKPEEESKQTFYFKEQNEIKLGVNVKTPHCDDSWKRN